MTDKSTRPVQTEASVLAFTPSPGVSLSGYSTEEPGMLVPEENAGGCSKTRSQYKPLKHWKSGECYRGNEEKRHLVMMPKQLGICVWYERFNVGFKG